MKSEFPWLSSPLYVVGPEFGEKDLSFVPPPSFLSQKTLKKDQIPERGRGREREGEREKIG